MDRDWKFVVIWEFHVQADGREKFEEAYGINGVWARFFESAEGYVRTELIRDTERAGCYVTLDFWSSKQSYEQFRQASADRYRAVDAECEALIESETKIGAFERLAG